MPGKNREFRIGDEDFPSLGNAYPRIYSAKDVEKNGTINGEQKQVLKDKSVIKNNNKTSCDKLSSKESKTTLCNDLSNGKPNICTMTNVEKKLSSNNIIPSKCGTSICITDRIKKTFIGDGEEEKEEREEETVDPDVVNEKYPYAAIYRKLAAKELSKNGIDASKILENRIEDEEVGNPGGYFDIPDFCLKGGLCPYGLQAFKNFYDHMQQNREKYMSYCYKDDIYTLLDDTYFLKDENHFNDIGSMMINNLCPPTNHSVNVPKEYMISKNIPKSKFPSLPLTYEKLELDTLFFLFFNCAGDILQLGAAFELIKREWLFHSSLKTWIKPVISNSTSIDKNTDSFIIFNVLKWMEEVVTISIDLPKENDSINHISPLPDVVIKYLHKRHPYAKDRDINEELKKRYEEELQKQEMQWSKLFTSTWLHYLSPMDAEQVSVKYLFQFSDPDQCEKIINRCKPKSDVSEGGNDRMERNNLHDTMNRYRESMKEKPLSKKILHEAVLKACANQNLTQFQNISFDFLNMKNKNMDKVVALENGNQNSNVINTSSSTNQQTVDQRQIDSIKITRHHLPLNDPNVNEKRDKLDQNYKLDLIQEEFQKLYSIRPNLENDIKRLKQEGDNIQNGIHHHDSSVQEKMSSINYGNQFDGNRLPNVSANEVYPYADMVSQIAAKHQQQLKIDNNIPLQLQYQQKIDNCLNSLNVTNPQPNINNSQVKFNGPVVGIPLEHIKIFNEMISNMNSHGMMPVVPNGGTIPSNPSVINRMGINDIYGVQSNNFPSMMPQCSPQRSQPNCNTMFHNPNIPIVPPQGFSPFGQGNIPNYGVPIPPIPINTNSMMYSGNNFNVSSNINFGAMNVMRGGGGGSGNFFSPLQSTYENGDNNGSIEKNNNSLTTSNAPYYSLDK